MRPAGIWAPAARMIEAAEQVVAVPSRNSPTTPGNDAMHTHKTEDTSDLIREGCKSYHKALFAVMEFRRQAGRTIRDAVESHLSELARSLQIDESELRDGILDYSKPENVTRTNFKGTEAQFGVRIPKKLSIKTDWRLQFYLWIGYEEPACFVSELWLRDAARAAEKLTAPESGLQFEGNRVWVAEVLDREEAVDLRAACERVLDQWNSAWMRVGGLPQFVGRQ